MIAEYFCFGFIGLSLTVLELSEKRHYFSAPRSVSLLHDKCKSVICDKYTQGCSFLEKTYVYLLVCKTINECYLKIWDESGMIPRPNSDTFRNMT